MKQNRISATAAATLCAMVLGLVGLVTTIASAQALPTPQDVESPMPINVMTNNPNGPNWLRAFDRHPAPASSRPTPMRGTRCWRMNHKMMANHRMMERHCMMERRCMMNHRGMMKHRCMMNHRWMMKHHWMMKHRMIRHPMPTPTPML